MNCNTTHYRANSSSVPGDPTKEDTLLALGLAVAAWAGVMRRRWRLAWMGPVTLGIAAGFALSTKYLGLLAFPFVIAVEWTANASPSRRARNLGLLAVAAAVAALACWRSALHAGGWAEVLDGFGEVAKAARQGNESIGRQIPHARYFGLFLISTSPLMLLGWFGALKLGLRRARPVREHLVYWSLFSLPVLLLAMLSFSALSAVRYLLPVSLFFSCFGCVGLAWLVPQALAWWRSPERKDPHRAVAAVAALLAVLFCIGLFLRNVAQLERGFASDDRLALRRWIDLNLPETATIAQDELACLIAPPYVNPTLVYPRRLLSDKFVADLGDLDALRRMGVTHVLVCWSSTRRFLEAGKQPAPGSGKEGDFARRRNFYQRLSAEARLLWKSELGAPITLRPGLALYAL